MATDEPPELIEGEPGDVEPLLDGQLAHSFQEMRFPGPTGATQNDVFLAANPLQRPQRPLGGQRDRRRRFIPDGQGLAGGKVGLLAAVLLAGLVPPRRFLREARPDTFGPVPPLRPRRPPPAPSAPAPPRAPARRPPLTTRRHPRQWSERRVPRLIAGGATGSARRWAAGDSGSDRSGAGRASRADGAPLPAASGG